MLIGVDLDNTIICYDQLFRKVALERALIPTDLGASKVAVRDHLRAAGKEDLWTEMQGYVYGPRLREALPFPGVIDFFKNCRRNGVFVSIISHRTRHPYRGEPYDLHQSARDWLVEYGFHDDKPDAIGLPVDRVFLEESKSAKVRRIAQVGCTHFIDDLLELLAEPEMPASVTKVLFDPSDRLESGSDVRRIASWEAITRSLLPRDI